MKFLIRVDGDTTIGGGHVMRCLTLANEAHRRGHSATFVMAATPTSMLKQVRNSGFPVFEISPSVEHPEDIDGPDHSKWLATSWQQDAAATAVAIDEYKPDWIVWDHYGLDARWVNEVRRVQKHGRFLAIDDLDDRPISSELVLDQTRITDGKRVQKADANLTGPSFALLRPEFAKLRPKALQARGKSVNRVLIAPGMVDGSGLSPLAIKALDRFPNIEIEVVMGSTSQTVSEVKNLLRERPNCTLSLDSTDMANQMAQADLCIGAGGMTSWERCCLGLPTIAIRTANNQKAVLDGLAEVGAVVSMSLDEAKDPSKMQRAIENAFFSIEEMSEASASLCDGLGAVRVLDALEGKLRPMSEDDSKQLFSWRNQPRIRAASLNSDALVWENHERWMAKTLVNNQGCWMIYSEGGRDLGHVNATRLHSESETGAWTWGFYIGEEGSPRGAGRRMLATFIPYLFDNKDVVSIFAEIKANNATSIDLHERFGFTQIATDDPQVLAFKLDRCNVKLVGAR